MLSISKSFHRFLLPCVVLTGGLLYAAPGGPDKITAEGEVAAGGATARFSLNAKDPSNPSGHLTYRDEGTGLHLRSTGITAYIIQSPTQRRIEGTGVLEDGSSVTWVVNAFDEGPGSSDQFAISISNGYIDNGFLLKGNVKINAAP
jgi:hypothetical protein